MSDDLPIVRKSEVFHPEKCPCGEFLFPDLVDTTMFARQKEWILTWRCPMEQQHRWKAANES